MQITTLGVALIGLGVVLFFSYPRSIYVLSIFFIPFTASSLLNTSSGVPLTPGQYFGGLFIIQQILFLVARHRNLVFYGNSNEIILFHVFLVSVLLSIFVPIVFDGGSQFALHSYSTSQAINGMLPVVFGIIWASFLVSKNRTIAELASTIRIYVISGVFVSLWGYLQFICNNILHIEYPWYIFNNAVLETMHGYKQVVAVDNVMMPRVSSVVHEPSMFAKYLLTVLPILVIGICRRTPILGRTFDWVALWIMVGILILSTSTTAYVGLFILIFVVLILLLYAKSLRIRYLFVFLLVPGSLVVLMFTVFPVANAVFDWLVIGKISSGSGIERVNSVKEAWLIFKQVPVFGAGWALVTSNDLFVFLLANVGLIGTTSFLVFLFYVLYRAFSGIRILRKVQEKESYKLVSFALGGLCSLLTLVTLGVITGIEFYLEYFYFVLVLVISANGIVFRTAKNSYGRLMQGDIFLVKRQNQ